MTAGPAITLAGGRIVRCRWIGELSHRLCLAAALRRTRTIIVNTPHNRPARLAADDRRRLADCCGRPSAGAVGRVYEHGLRRCAARQRGGDAELAARGQAISSFGKTYRDRLVGHVAAPALMAEFRSPSVQHLLVARRCSTAWPPGTEPAPPRAASVLPA
jgi:hypothetical protein